MSHNTQRGQASNISSFIRNAMYTTPMNPQTQRPVPPSSAHRVHRSSGVGSGTTGPSFLPGGSGGGGGGNPRSARIGFGLDFTKLLANLDDNSAGAGGTSTTSRGSARGRAGHNSLLHGGINGSSTVRLRPTLPPASASSQRRPQPFQNGVTIHSGGHSFSSKQQMEPQPAQPAQVPLDDQSSTTVSSRRLSKKDSGIGLQFPHPPQSAKQPAPAKAEPAPSANTTHKSHIKDIMDELNKEDGFTMYEGGKDKLQASGVLNPRQVLATYDHVLTRYERREVLDYDQIFFLGTQATKIDAPIANSVNSGYDDENGDYRVVMHDHIKYRYEVLSELGRGSFGQVLKCHDYKTNQQRALKIIRNKKRFHQQALIEIKILDHLRTRDPDEKSCTVRMVDHFVFRSHVVIIFELHSMNLYELTKANSYKPFSPALIKRFTAQLLVAVGFLWREHIVHCDLKPENILLKYENKTSIKVIDLGSSCFESERLYTYIQSRFYRAPEIILGLSYGRPIDLWSLGTIICEMAIGYPIFPGESEDQQLLCMMEVLGLPPQRMIERSPRRKKFFDTNNNPRVVPSPRGKLRQPGTKDLMSVLRTKDEQFVDFIMLLLRWEPMERATPGEAMRHPWIAECFQQEPQRTQPHPPVGATAGIGRSAPVSSARQGSAQHPAQRELPMIGAGQPTAGSSGVLLKKRSQHRAPMAQAPAPTQHYPDF